MCSSGDDQGGSKVFLSLGSNIGERRKRIEQAIEALEREGLVAVHRSSIYETEPVGLESQPYYLNAVVSARTNLEPLDLLAMCKRIEAQMGRTQSVRFGPRVIDIDILLFGESVVNSDRLAIPHPRMRERRFVLVPLVEVAPSIKDPRDGMRFIHILRGLDEKKKVTKLRERE